MTKINRNSFDGFISKHGHLGESGIKQARQFADIGDAFVRLAMTIKDDKTFIRAVEALESELPSPYNKPQYLKSNIASCFLYAQTRDNFKLRQGYGKGANINRYGNNWQSKQAVGNIMAYFSRQENGKESGYDAPSTHTKWRTNTIFPADIKNWRLRIDIDANQPGSIPAPLKGIRTLHLVPGIDKSGGIKLLVKAENWGMKKLLHKLWHALDYLITRFVHPKIEGLDNRPESKLLKEPMVQEQLTVLGDRVKKELEKAAKQDMTLDILNKSFSTEIKAIKSKKGLESPVNALKELEKTVNKELDFLINSNTLHLNNEQLDSLKKLKKTFAGEEDGQIGLFAEIRNALEAERNKKYTSAFQTHSEVRLLYTLDDKAEHAIPTIDNSRIDRIKKDLANIKASNTGSTTVPEPLGSTHQ